MGSDEQGQADTPDRRVAIWARAYRLLTEQAGFPPEDIIFDPNIFAVGTGLEEHNLYALAYLEAVRRIKETLPRTLVSGGGGNPSFPFRRRPHDPQHKHPGFLLPRLNPPTDLRDF